MRSRFTWACCFNAAIAFGVGLYAVLSARRSADELRLNQGLVFWALAIAFLALLRIFRRKPVRHPRGFEVITPAPDSPGQDQ